MIPPGDSDREVDMRWLLCAVALALGSCAAIDGGSPAADLPPDVAAGRLLAQRACSGCHGMTPDRPGIDHRAPAFWTLAGRHTPESLAAATRTTPAHDRLAMPSVTLSRADAANLTAYMAALGNAQKPDWRRLDVAPCIATVRC